MSTSSAAVRYSVQDVGVAVAVELFFVKHLIDVGIASCK